MGTVASTRRRTAYDRPATGHRRHRGVAVLGVYTPRHPELHSIPRHRLRSGILAESIASAVFAVEFLVSVVFPASDAGPWSCSFSSGRCMYCCNDSLRRERTA